MATPLYDKLVKVVATYIGDEKAAGSVGRQLVHCSATPETFSPNHMKMILSRVTTATSLYVTDAAKKTEFADKLKALAT